MKKVLLLSIAMMALTSCSNKTKELVYTYEKEENFSYFNIDPKDLGFKITKVEEQEPIIASDSASMVKDRFVVFWHGSKELGTDKGNALTFNTVRDTINMWISGREESLQLYKKELEYGIGDYMTKYSIRSSEEAIAEYKELIADVDGFEADYNKYVENPDKVLLHKYKVSYTIKNPLLGVKQTITNLYYIDGEKTKVVMSESLN